MRVKRYFNKWIALALSVTSLLAMPLYAADQKPALKVEDAVKAAISYSNQMAINTNEYESLKEQMKLNNEKTYYQYQSIYLQKAKNEQQKTMIEDQIENDVTSKYNNMIILQKEIQLANKNIDITSKELKQMELKNSKGLINPVTYQSKQVELMNLKTNKAAKEDELKNAQAYFKVITGKDLTQYTLDDTIKYEPFKIKGVVEGYASSKIQEYLKYDKDLAKLKEDTLLEDNGKPIFYSDYLTNKSAAETQTLSLEEKQKNLKQTVITNYTSLLSIEEQISSLQSQFDVLDKKIKSTELKYKSGLVSSLEYDKQLYEKQDLEFKKLKLISNYNSLKEAIEKPWAAVNA